MTEAFGEVDVTCAAQMIVADDRLLLTGFTAMLALGLPTCMHCEDQAEACALPCRMPVGLQTFQANCYCVVVSLHESMT